MKLVKTSLTPTEVSMLNAAFDFMNSNSFRRTSINELVNRFRLTEDKLTRGFKSKYGVSVYQYQLRIAMEYAALLLQKGDLVKSVSISLGYKTSGNFARAFYKVFKKRPSEYRCQSCSS